MTPIYDYMNKLKFNDNIHPEPDYDRMIIRMLKTRMNNREYGRRYKGDLHKMVVTCITEFGVDKLHDKLEDMGMV